MIGYADDVEYARSRLVETIVRVGGVPVLVNVIEGKNAVHCTDLTTGNLITVKLKDLDINPVPLGYANVHNVALYVVRTPKRQDWRQGLRQNTIRVTSLKQNVAPPIPALDDAPIARPRAAPRLERAFAINYTDLVPTIMGTYPKVDEVFDKFKAKKNMSSHAFSRNFAITRLGDLIFKGVFSVGKISPKKDYELERKYDFVRELLEEELIAA